MILTSLAGYNPKEVKVPVPELAEGGEVLLREMIGDRSASFWALPSDQQVGINVLIASMIDESGTQAHSYSDAENLQKMVPNHLLSRLIKAAFEINGLGSLSEPEQVINAKKN